MVHFENHDDDDGKDDNENSDDYEIEIINHGASVDKENAVLEREWLA